MKQIQPIQIWQNGELVEVSLLSAVVASDNLKDAASFYYTLYTGDVRQVVNGGLAMGGEDYENWNANPSINEAAYVWIAGKLNLTIVGDYVPTIITTTVTEVHEITTTSTTISE